MALRHADLARFTSAKFTLSVRWLDAEWQTFAEKPKIAANRTLFVRFLFSVQFMLPHTARVCFATHSQWEAVDAVRQLANDAHVSSTATMF